MEKITSFYINIKLMNFIKNYFSTISFILIWYFFYTDILNLIISIINFFIHFINIITWDIFSRKLLEIWTHHEFFFKRELSLDFFSRFKLNSETIFQFVVFLYTILLVPFYLTYREKNKARIIINFLYRFISSLFTYKINKKEKLSILSWIVKLFFAPLMIFWLTWHIFDVINNSYRSYNYITNIWWWFLEFFNMNLFYLCFTIILFFDVFFFTMWYLIEAPFLKNKIKSVDPFLTWWLVALICYPPFNSYLTNIIWRYSTDFPHFQNEFIHVFLNTMIILLMWIYSLASISLWFKASNLTNRWIVSSWPYKYIRHPAYITKNLSWRIWWLPFMINAINIWDYKKLMFILIWLSWWTIIYFLRAITEERHLSLDEDYIKYKKKVKYKFIPWVY